MYAQDVGWGVKAPHHGVHWDNYAGYVHPQYCYSYRMSVKNHLNGQYLRNYPCDRIQAVICVFR